eukprot:gene2047-2739_t
MEARTEGPEPTLPGEAEAEGGGSFEMVEVKPQWKVIKTGLIEDLDPILRLKYCGVILDCVYQLDKEKRRVRTR